jgi:chorismate lyase/3-hydroxybenzoate synthase
MLAGASPPPLGSLGYGLPTLGSDALAPAGVGVRVLSAAGPKVDAWFSSAPIASGRCGSVRWQHDGQWLYGTLDIDEATTAEDLTALSRRAYHDVFATLQQTGCPHLLRLWNYLPDINADAGGMERYRQFNIGRQQAFLDARRDAFEGSPAACAIGTRSGPFSVRFLAGWTRPVAVENPRQVSAYHYPQEFGPRSPTFSRAALMDAGAGQVALLISGTASIVGHASVHPGDVQAQTQETLVNLQAVIQAAHARCTARFDLSGLECTVYVRHADHEPLIRQTIEKALGTDAPAARTAVYLEADICRSELLVEIEAHAFASGKVMA